MKNNQTNVLIAGAGPSGLMAACWLAFYGIPFRIIDKKDRKTGHSGALLVQARTLEIFKQMGIADFALQKGKIAEYMTVIHNGKKILRLSISSMGEGISDFPFIFMLKQTCTEKLLQRYLERYGVCIERNTTLVDLKQDKHSVISEIEFSDGRTEHVTSKYLIGADGMHSTVRKTLNIPWHGKRSSFPLVVSDCHIRKTMIHEKKHHSLPVHDVGNEIMFSISNKSIAGFFSLGKDKWRIDSVIPENIIGREQIRFEDIQEGFGDRIQINVELHTPQWFSVFYPNTYLAGTFSAGRCFLVGDAAHVHTPIGAQGMNTGMQDSYNLAWKLAFVLKHNINPKLMATYNQERRQVAGRLIRSTDRYFDIAIGKDSFNRLLRTKILPWLLYVFKPIIRQKFLKRNFFRAISQTKVGYHVQAGLTITGLSKGPSKGERWPFLEWRDEQGIRHNLQDSLHQGYFTLFFFCKNKQKLASIQSKLQEIESRYSEFLAVETIVFTKNQNKIFRQSGIRNSGYYLIRPDGYISLKIKHRGLQPLQDYLAALMN